MKFHYFLVLFIIGGVCLALPATSHAQAQTTALSSNLYTMDKTQFVLPDLAISRLDNAMQSLKSQMAGFDQNTPQYQQINGKYAYYGTMRRLLADEKATLAEQVRTAITRGLGVYASDAYGNVPYNQKLQNKQDAIQLLKA